MFIFTSWAIEDIWLKVIINVYYGDGACSFGAEVSYVSKSLLQTNCAEN